MKQAETSTGEWLAYIAASAFMVTRVTTALYKRALNMMTQQMDAKHPSAVQQIQQKKQQKRQQLQDLLGDFQQGKVVENNNGEFCIEFESPEAPFWKRYLGRTEILSLGVASVHTTVYYVFRRFFTQPESPSDSLKESVAGTIPTLVGLTYLDLDDAYQHTLKFSAHRRVINTLVEKEKVNPDPANNKIKTN